jgi:hypothetical protein
MEPQNVVIHNRRPHAVHNRHASPREFRTSSLPHPEQNLGTSGSVASCRYRPVPSDWGGAESCILLCGLSSTRLTPLSPPPPQAGPTTALWDMPPAISMPQLSPPTALRPIPDKGTAGAPPPAWTAIALCPRTLSHDALVETSR